MQLILGQPIVNDPRIKLIVNGSSLTIEEARKEELVPEILSIQDKDVNQSRVEVRCLEDVIFPPGYTFRVNVNLISAFSGEDIYV